MILEKRLEQIYSAALEKCLKKYKEFLQKVQDVDDGKIQPPQWYVDRNMVDKWRQGFLRELIRQEKIIDGIMQEMVNAGMEAEKLIKESMVELYRSTRAQAAKRIEDGAKANGVHIRLREMDRQAVKTILQEEQSPFSKIAFNNLGKNIAIRRKFQNDMALSILLGESQQKMSQRIRRVAVMAKYQADRVAQTERTRVQAQATMQTSQEAEKLGVRVYHEWSTRMVRSRDTHIALDGKCALPGEKFPDSVLRYPGDPNAPAGEVINCHCVLTEYVLLPNEQIVDGRVVKINTEPLRNQGKSGIMKLPDIPILHSLGAKSVNYDIMDLATGDMYRLIEGTKLTNVEVFAGKGVHSEYRKAYKYANIHGGKVEDWQYVKGVGYVETDEGERKAELHWSQCENIGKFDFFIKRWLDE